MDAGKCRRRVGDGKGVCGESGEGGRAKRVDGEEEAAAVEEGIEKREVEKLMSGRRAVMLWQAKGARASASGS